MKKINTGMNFRCIREGVNLSESEAADFCDVTADQIKSWESSNKIVPNIAVEKIQALAEVADARVRLTIDNPELKKILDSEKPILHTTFACDATYRKFDWDNTYQQLRFASLHRNFSLRMKMAIEQAGGSCQILLFTDSSYALFKQEFPNHANRINYWEGWEYSRIYSRSISISELEGEDMNSTLH